MRSRALLFVPVFGTFFLGGAFVACIDADGLDTGNALGTEGDATVTTIQVDGSPVTYLSDGACAANVQTDPRNCGACGNVCGATSTASAASTGYTCAAGKCAIACNPGYADCNGAASDGCEIRVENDPNNCGGCGLSCGGGTCAGSVCGATTVLAATTGTLVRLAVDANNLYWSTSGPSGVWSMPKAGGTPSEISDAGVGPTSLESNGSKLYVADPASADIFSIDTDGGAFAVASAAAGVGTFALYNGTGLVWTVPANPDGVSAPSVNALLGDAGPVILYTQTTEPYFLAVAANAVFTPSQAWLAGADTPGAPTSDSIYRCALPSCSGTASVFATGQSRPYGIAADSVNVYWTTQGTQQGNGTVSYCPLTGCPTTTLPDGGVVSTPIVYASKLAEPSLIAADGAGLYWLQGGDATVRSLPAPQALDAGTASSEASPRILASGIRGLSQLAIDDMYVYWTDVAGSIGRVRK